MNFYEEDLKACNGEVFVVDAPCGHGKTQMAIYNIIYRAEGQRFIYITPYLNEVARVKKACRDVEVEVFEPNVKMGKGVKFNHFKQLLTEGKSIITTHSMFDRIDETCIQLLKQQGYILYLDEVHEVIKEHSLTRKDLDLLLECKYIKIHDDGLVEWLDEEYEGKFEEFKALCNLGAMYFYGGRLFMWCFPVSVFQMMKRTYIMTYLFEGQIQSAYYSLHNIQYKKLWVVHFRFMYFFLEYDEKYDKEFREKIRDKIHIYEGNLNYTKGITLTSSWYNKATDEDYRVVRLNTLNYFVHIVKGKSEYNMWTCLKAGKSKLKGKGYSKGFVELNARATNEFKHKKNLAYLYNRYLKPTIYSFLKTKGIEFNQELYALGDLMQWIFRSRIREGGEINIYIPSERMRGILKKYLDKD